MFTLAHFSDPHIGPLPPARLSELMSKRFLGWLSWQRRRRREHRREILDALAADLLAQAPDHVVITGDLTNIALPAEFTQAAEWLKRLGASERISVVPGNHDAYVAVPWEQGLACWSDFMAGDAGEPAAATGFPFLRRRGPLAIIGLSTALPTPPGSAAGALGADQLERLESCLEALAREGVFRCILLHHPPLDGVVSRRKRLLDAEGFRQVLGRAGAELVLHGHDHDFHTTELGGPKGKIPVVGVPSASAGGGGHRPAAHYHLYGIERHDGTWRVEVRARGLPPGASDLAETRVRRLEVPA